MSGQPVPSQLDQVLPRFYVQKAGPYHPFGKIRIAPFGKGGLRILAEVGVYNNPCWNLITAMADDAIEYLNRVTAINPNQPFFIYYVPGAVHAPHHPTPEWIKKISDMHLFDQGWNKLRETIFANQKRLGVLPQDAKLTPWPKDLLKEWDTLSADEKKLFIRQADVFAAYMAYTDHEIGRVIQHIEDIGKLDNTLIIYIAGDNGNSAEGTLIGTPNEVASLQGISVPVEDQLKYFYDAWGTDKTYPHMAVAWTWALELVPVV